MSALRNNKNNYFAKMAKRDEMDLIFPGGDDTPANHNWVQFLIANPNTATRLGEDFIRMAADFEDCYPGETRVETISNADLEQENFPLTAQINKMMGLPGS